MGSVSLWLAQEVFNELGFVCFAGMSQGKRKTRKGKFSPRIWVFFTLNKIVGGSNFLGKKAGLHLLILLGNLWKFVHLFPGHLCVDSVFAGFEYRGWSCVHFDCGLQAPPFSKSIRELREAFWGQKINWGIPHCYSHFVNWFSKLLPLW